MKRLTRYAALWLMAMLLVGCAAQRPPMPTREKAEELFRDNFALIDSAAALLWEHHDELDTLVSDGESRVNMYSNGRTEDDFPYSKTSLTEEDKAVIFSAWRLLGSNALNVTYHMALPGQAPVIALYCGYDEQGRSFGYYYIRPVEEGDAAQDTVTRRIESNGYSNTLSYAEWQPLDCDFWYQGTTALAHYRQ